MPRLRSVFPADTVGTPAAAGLEENPQGRLRRSAERGLRREQANPPRSALQVSAHCDVCGVNKLCASAFLSGNRRDVRREKGPLSEGLLLARWATAAWGRSAYRSLAGRWWNTTACGVRQTDRSRRPRHKVEYCNTRRERDRAFMPLPIVFRA